MTVASIPLTPRVRALRARIVTDHYLPPAGGFRRLASRSERWIHCLAYPPQGLTVRDRLVINAVTMATGRQSLAHERRA